MIVYINGGVKKSGGMMVTIPDWSIFSCRPETVTLNPPCALYEKFVDGTIYPPYQEQSVVYEALVDAKLSTGPIRILVAEKAVAEAELKTANQELKTAVDMGDSKAVKEAREWMEQMNNNTKHVWKKIESYLMTNHEYVQEWDDWNAVNYPKLEAALGQGKLTESGTLNEHQVSIIEYIINNSTQPLRHLSGHCAAVCKLPIITGVVPRDMRERSGFIELRKKQGDDELFMRCRDFASYFHKKSKWLYNEITKRDQKNVPYSAALDTDKCIGNFHLQERRHVQLAGANRRHSLKKNQGRITKVKKEKTKINYLD